MHDILTFEELLSILEDGDYDDIAVCDGSTDWAPVLLIDSLEQSHEGRIELKSEVSYIRRENRITVYCFDKETRRKWECVYTVKQGYWDEDHSNVFIEKVSK